MLQTLKALEGEGRARRDRVNANQERVSIKIALNLSVWSLVAWVSHLAGSLSAAPRDYFTALRFDIISVEEREWDGCNEWDTVISTSFAQQLFSVENECGHCWLSLSTCQVVKWLIYTSHQGSGTWLSNSSLPLFLGVPYGAPTGLVVFLTDLSVARSLLEAVSCCPRQLFKAEGKKGRGKSLVQV